MHAKKCGVRACCICACGYYAAFGGLLVCERELKNAIGIGTCCSSKETQFI